MGVLPVDLGREPSLVDIRFPKLLSGFSIQRQDRLDLPGNPAVYGTTELLLEKMGLQTLDDLPPLADHVPPADFVDSLEESMRPGAG